MQKMRLTWLPLSRKPGNSEKLGKQKNDQGKSEFIKKSGKSQGICLVKLPLQQGTGHSKSQPV
jgi:hypothetical protein